MKNYDIIYYFTQKGTNPDLSDKQKYTIFEKIKKLYKEAGALILEGIKYANTKAGVSELDFGKGLIANAGLAPIFDPKKYPNGASYSDIDFQACIKYLYYGGQRSQYQDQRNFLDLFVPGYFYDSQNKLHAGDFGWALFPSMKVRNEHLGHDPLTDPADKITFAVNPSRSFIDVNSVPYCMKVLENLISPLCDHEWDPAAKQRCIEFRENMWNSIYLAAGELPYNMDAILDFVRIPRNEKGKVISYFKNVGIRVDGETVYVLGDAADIAYALYYAYRASSKKGAELFEGLYESVKLDPNQNEQDEAEPDWDTLSFADLEARANNIKSPSKIRAHARYRLGLCYKTGTGIAKDKIKAYNLFFDSANMGCANAQVELGKCLESGSGIVVRSLIPEFEPRRIINLEKAAKWYQTATEQSCAEGMYNLGRCYEYGIGVKADKDQAFIYYQSAGERGCKEAAAASILLQLKEHHLYGFVDEEGEVTDARTMLGDHLSTPFGKTALGMCCQYGWRMEPDILEAVRLYQEAAEEGDGKAKYLLAQCYRYGWGVDIDLSAYGDLLFEAVELDYLDAVVEYYFNPYAKNHQEYPYAMWLCAKHMISLSHPDAPFSAQQEIFKLVESASDQGYIPARSLLAYCYLQDIGTGLGAPHEGMALHLYKSATLAGDIEAFCFFANHSYNNDVDNGHDEAYAVAGAKPWYEAAAKRGSRDAQSWLVKHCAPEESERWREYACKCGNTDFED